MGQIKLSKAILLGSAAIAALVAGVGSASAGGFAIREQSAQFLGTAWAGSAAGGGLSSMYWNPAAMSTVQGTNSETNITGLLLSMEDHVTRTDPAGLAFFGDSGDLGGFNVIPASYFSTQLSKDLYLGFAINSPFGLATKADPAWAGQNQARTSKIFTLDVNPNIAYRVAPGITIGAGLQVEFIKARLTSASAAPSPANPQPASLQLRGDDVAVGFTAGVHLQPLAGTQIGIGFRSSIDHSIEGGITVPAAVPPVPNVLAQAVAVPLETPETVTASLRQKLTPQLDFLLTGEWSNWSRVQRLRATCEGVGGPLCPAAGAVASNKILGWHDGWMVSGGLEYQMSPALQLRGGVAYEQSPVRNPEERLVSLPDSNRLWVSVGAGYKWSEALSFDVAYSHIFAEDGRLSRGPLQNEPVLIEADTKAHAEVFAVAMKVKWGGAPEPVGPLK